ncbi:hypothetical protein VNI00_001865 [Paramarasmius palmivorus]|uniref:Uncharacterized protein n=1 Tax=Paramarasmius palmivorus TaxID=297713 RepID=A0AAW0E5T3_9AGAR
MSFRSTSKAPLITPSASPPTSKKASSNSSRGRSTSVSLLKRTRLSSSRAPSVASHSAHAEDNNNNNNVVDVVHEREQSVKRLMDTWAQLEERYSRPMEEDDIVDLITGDVVKDRGVLRGMSTRWEFGRLADEEERIPGSRSASRISSTSTRESGTSKDGDGGESEDELDSFAHISRSTKPDTASDDNDVQDSEPGEDDAEEAEDIAAFIAPSTRVRALDPNDAEDAAELQEFLEAEKRRREIYGNEETDDEQSALHEDSPSALEDGSSRLELSRSSDQNENARSSESVDDADSEDELALRDNDSNAVARDSQSIRTLEPLDTTTPKPKRSIGSIIGLESTKERSHLQLQTPPLSHSSAPSPFSHISSDNDTYYDYTVPISERSPDDTLSLPLPPSSPLPSSSPPLPSSPLPPSSPPAPSSPLAPSSPSECGHSPTSNLTTSRRLRGVSSSPPSSPSKPERKQKQNQNPKTATSSFARPIKKSVPVVLIEVPRKPSSSGRASSHIPQDDDWNLPSTSTIPRVDLSKEMLKKRKSMVKKTSTSSVKDTTIFSTSTKGKEKERPSVSPSPKRGRRASSVSVKPGPEDMDRRESIAGRTRSHLQMQNSPIRPKTFENKLHSSITQTSGKWKGKAKEVEIDSQRDEEPDSDGITRFVSGLKKRKRARSSSASEANDREKTLSKRSPSSDELEVQHRHSSKPRPPKQKPKLDHYVDSEQADRNPPNQRHEHDPGSPPPRRAQSYMDPHYPPSYLPGYPKHEEPQPFIPIYDPRAQSILSNAFHQLSALFGGGWIRPPPGSVYDMHSDPERPLRSQPFARAQSHHPYPYEGDPHYAQPSPRTPRHSRPRAHSILASDATPGSSSSSQNYIMTPTHRPHPHPYSYDPNLSRGTLPPESSSPEPETDEDVGQSTSTAPANPLPASRSHPMHHGGLEERPVNHKRTSSLVKRSRSRGRRVSWGSVEHINVRFDEYINEEGNEDAPNHIPDKVEHSTSSRGLTVGVTPARQLPPQRKDTVRGSSLPVRDNKREPTPRRAASPPRLVENDPEIIELTDSELDEDEGETPRGRRTVRGQTPGPAIRKGKGRKL